MIKKAFKHVLFDYLKYRNIKNFFYFESLLFNISFKKEKKFGSKKIYFNNYDWINKTILLYVNKINYKNNYFVRDSKNINKEKLILSLCKKLIIISKKANFYKKKIKIPVKLDLFYKNIINNNILKGKIKRKNKKYFLFCNTNKVSKEIKKLQEIPGILSHGFCKKKKKSKIIEINKESIKEFDEN
ncbi:hypothetical protein ACWNX6_00110 [Candidatus Vidania fulgoroideorum]